MIKDNKIQVGIINHNLNHYKNIGFDVKYGDVIVVQPFQLSSGSHYKVDCICDECGKVKNMKYQFYYKITNGLKENYYCQKCVKKIKTSKTNMEKYGYENASSSVLIKEKRKKTNLKKWGTENVFQNEDIKKRNRDTFNEKYGDYYTRTKEYREKSNSTRIKKNSKIFENEKLDYKRYKRLVRSYTRIFSKSLFENWNGLDYYDNEYIKENFNLNYNDVSYPTIDHKISVFNGFKKMINPEIIGGINNLCVTKRNNNSSKRSHLEKPKRLNEDQF